eukprot:3832490-Pleurochrysis_carterae.AAC.2
MFFPKSDISTWDGRMLQLLECMQACETKRLGRAVHAGAVDAIAGEQAPRVRARLQGVGGGGARRAAGHRRGGRRAQARDRLSSARLRLPFARSSFACAARSSLPCAKMNLACA